jgi:hypothetical protein
MLRKRSASSSQIAFQTRHVSANCATKSPGSLHSAAAQHRLTTLLHHSAARGRHQNQQRHVTGHPARPPPPFPSHWRKITTPAAAPSSVGPALRAVAVLRCYRCLRDFESFVFSDEFREFARISAAMEGLTCNMHPLQTEGDSVHARGRARRRRRRRRP